MQPTPSPIKPIKYNPMMMKTMQLPQVLMKANSTSEKAKLAKMEIKDIFQVALRSLMTRSK